MKLQFKDNSFDLLIIMAAIIIVLSHSFRWFEVTKPQALLFLTDGSTGVMMFFGMTGYLIMGAYERSLANGKRIGDFLFNRIVRLYPALIVSFLVITSINVFLLKLNIFSIEFLKHGIYYMVLGKGGGYLGKGISNGVLWTIPVDIIFYLLAPLIYKYGKKLSMTRWIVVIIIMWQFNIWDKYVIDAFGKLPVIGKFVGIDFFLCFMYEFLIGSFLYFYRDIIIVKFAKMKYLITLLMLFCVCFYLLNYSGLIPSFGQMHNPIQGILVPPLTILFAYGLGKHNLSNDISYGIFMYHMIVIGVLLYLGISGCLGIVLTLIITPLLGLISCKYIEKPQLKWKRY